MRHRAAASIALAHITRCLTPFQVMEQALSSGHPLAPALAALRQAAERQSLEAGLYGSRGQDTSTGLPDRAEAPDSALYSRAGVPASRPRLADLYT